MTERRKLAKQLSLAALIICGLALGGCGDGGNNSPNDLDDPDPNQAPVCNLVAVFVDVATQEIVVQVEAWDPDLIDFSFGLDLSFEIITATATYTNDVLTSTTGAPIIGNTVFDAAHTNTAPGALTEVRISSTTPVLMVSDPNATLRVTVQDPPQPPENAGIPSLSSTCTMGFPLILLSEPTCNIDAPTGGQVMGNVAVDVTVMDAQSDPASVTGFYSLDGGTTLLPATLVGGVAVVPCDPANPGGMGVTNAVTSPAGVLTTLTWDTVTDGIGLTVAQDVVFVVYVEDCTTAPPDFNAPCQSAVFSVINNGEPTCTVDTPAGGAMVGGTGTVTIGCTTVDADSANIDSTFHWSSDGGTTWSLCTPAAPSTNPLAAAPGAITFDWDVPADIPVASLPACVAIRLTADDGAGRVTPLPTCVTTGGAGCFDLVPISEPTCTFTAPAAGACFDGSPAGLVDLVFDLNDPQGDPISFTVCVNGAPATLVATTNGALAAYVPTDAANTCAGAANQVTGATSGATTVTWDFVADGLGAAACDAAAVQIYAEDGTTAGAGPFSGCTLDFSVANNGPPSCAVTGLGDTTVTFDLTDADSAAVDCTFEYSTDAGATYALATAGGGATNPESRAPGVGLTWAWAGTTDLPTCTTGVLMRITVDDGVLLANRPATCVSAATDINCVPTLTNCRAVEAVGTVATGPTGVVPSYLAAAGAPPASGNIADNNPFATNFWDFDYVDLNAGPFNTTVQLTDAGGNNVGNPVVLMSAGQDYTTFTHVGPESGPAAGVPFGPDPDPTAPCSPVDTFQVVLEGSLSGVVGDYAVASTPVGTAFLNTTWTTSDPGMVDVSVNGLLTAVGENGCATITWAIASTDALEAVVAPTCTTGDFVACVDSAGVDTASRNTFMPVGDLDANIPGLPSGPALPGVGATFGFTIMVSTGTEGIGAYALGINFDETIIDHNSAVDIASIGGCSQANLGGPFAVNNTQLNAVRWNDVEAFGTHAGYFDISTVNFIQIAAGTTHVVVWNEELANAAAENIWTMNTCMPYNSYPPLPPPLGGYPSISTVADIVVP